MISLRVSATKLAKENEPEEIPKEFPSRLELAMNYTRCWQIVFYSVLLFSTILTCSLNQGSVSSIALFT